jgi:hypothetical protein
MKRILWNRNVKLDKNEKIVYMTPRQFLSQTPSVRGYKKGEPIPPASKNKPSDFTESSIHYIKD